MLEWHDNLDRNKPGLLEVSTDPYSCPLSINSECFLHSWPALVSMDEPRWVGSMTTITRACRSSNRMKHITYNSCGRWPNRPYPTRSWSTSSVRIPGTYLLICSCFNLYSPLCRHKMPLHHGPVPGNWSCLADHRLGDLHLDLQPGTGRGLLRWTEPLDC